MHGFSPDPNRLFSKVTALNINLPPNLAKQIRCIVEYYNGKCLSVLDPSCTHAIALDYDRELHDSIQTRLSRPVCFVTPDWITDCVDADSIIDVLKYNPKYLKTTGDNHLMIVNSNIVATNVHTTKPIADEDNSSRPKSHHYTPVITIKTDNFFNQNIIESLDGMPNVFFVLI